jgi:DNA-directed RNA polymerase subunit RPC12/RpoP
MSALDYKDLRRHIGHSIVCVGYGEKGRVPVNVAVECEDCSEVLLSLDKDTKIQKTLSENTAMYICEQCGNIVYWTIKDFQDKGEPVCTQCGDDMTPVK